MNAVKSLIVPYIRAADEAAPQRAQGDVLLGTNVLVDAHRPEDLVKRLAFSHPETEGRGREGLLDAIRDVLRYSVNTWDQGFLDKLYSSTNAVSCLISSRLWGYMSREVMLTDEGDVS